MKTGAQKLEIKLICLVLILLYIGTYLRREVRTRDLADHSISLRCNGNVYVGTLGTYGTILSPAWQMTAKAEGRRMTLPQ